MKTNKKHISSEDFQRYLENRMTDAERNAFERMLQKHPFEAEALEGFQQISPADLKNDLTELSGKITLAKKKKNTRFWAAAATFLLLISAGVVWFQLKEKSPVPEVSEVKTVQKEEPLQTTKTEEPETLEFAEPVQNDEKNISTKKSAGPVIQKSVKKEVAKKAIAPVETRKELQDRESESENMEPIQFAVVDEEVKIQEDTVLSDLKETYENVLSGQVSGISVVNSTQKSAMPGVQLARNKLQKAPDSTKTIKGKIISLDENMPLPGVTIVEKGTANGTVSDIDGNFTLQLSNNSDSILVASFVGMEEKEFTPAGDSNLMVGLESSQLALDEVVVVGYGTQKRSETTGSVSSANYNDERVIIDAQPVKGIAFLNKYIEENAVLPEDAPENKIVVRVALKINSDGKIVSVENKNEAEQAIFEKTKQLLLNGPAWQPKTINGVSVESEITLRVVFKKEKEK